MNKYYLINTKNIQQYLSELDKKKPGRTLCGLDLMKENIEKNLIGALSQNDELMVEIDYDKKEVTLLGDTLPTDNRNIVFDKEKNNESIYNTFMFAIDYAKQVEGGENLIKEIKPA